MLRLLSSAICGVKDALQPKIRTYFIKAIKLNSWLIQVSSNQAIGQSRTARCYSVHVTYLEK